MKKFLMMVAFVAATMTANAQVYVGGGLGFNSHDNGAESSTAFEIMPEVGYQLDDKLAVGITLGYESEADGDITTLSLAPYARYTFVSWDKVSLFADAQFEFAQTDTEGAAKVNAWSIGVMPGLKVNITDNLSLVTKAGWLGYKSAKADVDGAEAVTDLGLNLNGANLQFAVYYNF